jgi:hypothetical protein
MSEFKTYVFRLDYGDRESERKFITDALNAFDKNTLTGGTVFVGNSPYNLELYLSITFEKDDLAFERWLSTYYPHKIRTYNKFIDELVDAATTRKAYNVFTLLDPALLGQQMPSKANEMFLYPDRRLLETIWGKPRIPDDRKVFLSHSSKDKEIIDTFFNEIQKSEVRAWYDREEIIAGDSITNKINQGLRDCELGIIFLSPYFLSKRSGWTEAESNYFIQERMKRNKTFIVVNLGVPDCDMPPLLMDYRYVNGHAPSAAKELVY